MTLHFINRGVAAAAAKAARPDINISELARRTGYSRTHVRRLVSRGWTSDDFLPVKPPVEPAEIRKDVHEVANRSTPQVQGVADPALMGVHALVQGLRAGQAELERLGWEGKAARRAAKAERRQETRTKLLAFFLFVLMASLMIGFMYAGIKG